MYFFRSGNINGFMKTKEAAEKWDIFIISAKSLWNGRVYGVQCIGSIYLLPEYKKRPTYAYVHETEKIVNS